VIHRSLTTFFVGIVLAAVASVASALTVTSTVVAGQTDLTPGETVTLRYSTVGFPPFLGADINVSFDAGVATLDDVEFGDFALTSVTDPPALGPAAAPAITAAATGLTTRLLLFSRFFDPPVSGDVRLFDLTFRAVGPGTTDVTLVESPTAPFNNGFDFQAGQVVGLGAPAPSGSPRRRRSLCRPASRCFWAPSPGRGFCCAPAAVATEPDLPRLSPRPRRA